MSGVWQITLRRPTIVLRHVENCEPFNIFFIDNFKVQKPVASPTLLLYNHHIQLRMNPLLALE